VKATAYTTLVRPSIEYASSVWDPYTRNNIHQLEAIQRRAARFVYNNFYDRVVTSMICRLQWESLEQRRAKARATFMYKIAKYLVDVHAEHILTPSDNKTRGNAAYRTLLCMRLLSLLLGRNVYLRLRKPMVQLAFADMLLMWLFQLKSELNVTPRYLLSLVASSMWLCRV
jgi:hypothetical protein